MTARLTAGSRSAPNYLVIGVKRGGTTSLQRYLARHPQVARTNAVKGTHYFDVHYRRGWSWYLSHFPRRSQVGAHGWRAVGEASVYYCFHPLALDRMAADLPDARLIMMVRDPVDRAWSHYLYERARGFEDLDFSAALDAEAGRLAGSADRLAAGGADAHHRHHAYLARGRYADQVESVWQRFPREQLLVVGSEELFAQPAATMAGVYEFLGLDPLDGQTAASFEPFNANEPEPLEPGLRQRLAAAYAQDNERLFELLGRRFPWTPPT